MQVIPGIIENKTIAVVDEAIQSCTTLQRVLPKLDAAEEVNVRISSPPIRSSLSSKPRDGATEIADAT